MAEEPARRAVAPSSTPRRDVAGATQGRPAALANPDKPHEQPFTFSFSSGRHPRIRATLEAIEAILSRTLYRPLMRFTPVQVENVIVPVAGLPESLHGVRIAQLSDLHHSQIVPLSIIEEAVALTNGLAPDAVFLTGDFVSNDVSYAAECARVMAALHAPLGVFAILGNHDYWTDPAEVTAQLQRHGISVLNNASARLADGLWVAGIDDAWSGQPDLDQALAGIPTGVTTILLAHEPDFADQAQGRGIALQLSGHSHGGQVRVPFTSRPVLPFLSWKYYSGLRRVGDLWLYTNPGLGTMQPPFIFRCRPAVALLELQPAA